MHNITPLIKSNSMFTDKNAALLQPAYARVPVAHKDDEDLLELLSPDYNFDYLGSDILGGVAFFGKQADIDLVEEKVESYLNALGSKYDGQFYMRWNQPDTDDALILLYDDYIQPSEPLILTVLDNVFSTYFGAWTDDYPLPDVLDTPDYFQEGWTIGSETFDPLNEAHWAKIKSFKQFVKLIDIQEPEPGPSL